MNAVTRPPLRFYCRGTALVQDPHAMSRAPSVNRNVGRRWQQLAPPVGVGPDAHPGTWVWAPTGEVEAIPHHNDLVDACRSGDLWAADEATAKACGVAFDPDFGNEPHQTMKDFKAGLPGLTIAERRAEKEAAEAAEKKAPEPKKHEPPSDHEPHFGEHEEASADDVGGRVDQ